MSSDLRDALSLLAARKFELNATHTSCLDLNGDKQVDCVVSVHDPNFVVLEAPGAQCPSKGQIRLDADHRRKFTEILTPETTVRTEVRGDFR